MSAPTRKPASKLASLTLHLALVLILLSVLLHGLLGPLPADNLRMQIVLGVGSLAWLLASSLGGSGAGNTRLIVAGAIALQLLGLVGEPSLSDDVYRYVWEGDLVAQGASPYAHAPNSPALAAQQEALHEVYARLNNPDVSAAYPPVAQYAFALVVGTTRWIVRAAGIGGDPGMHAVFVMRIFFALCAVLALFPLFSLLDRAGRSRSYAVLWGWSPLVALEFAGSGHFDSLGILLMLVGLVLWSRPRHKKSGIDDGGAVVALTLATLVKFLPGVTLLFALRERPRKRLLGWVVFLSLLMYLPVLLLTGGGQGLWRGLTAYGRTWEGGSLVHRWLDPALRAVDMPWDLDLQLVGRILLGVAWLLCLLVAWRRRLGPVRASGMLFGAFLVLSPTVHPWYLTWVMPFLVLRPNLAFQVWIAAAPLMYWPLSGWLREGVWSEPEWQGPVFSITFGVLWLLAAGASLLRKKPAA
ncbi:MAG: alpha-1,6-mannosyltransferase [Chlamydiales bacterium]|jgi:alpha-1,6-mannosyltransferase